MIQTSRVCHAGPRTTDIKEPQKLVVKKSELYAREMAGLVKILYREVHWFKEATKGACPSECKK